MTPDEPTEADKWFADKLDYRYVVVGRHATETRRYLIRIEILTRGIEDERLGRNRDGVDETFREAFERIYQQKLETGEAFDA